MEPLSFDYVFSNLPKEWDHVEKYTTSYILRKLSKDSEEYRQVEEKFNGGHVKEIQRVQNPYQYGCFLRRRYKLLTDFSATVYHAVHKDDITIALQHNCDYRRYTRLNNDGVYENHPGFYVPRIKHPTFYHSFQDLMREYTIYPLCSICVVVLNLLDDTPKTQFDYYPQYYVTFN